MPPSAVAGFLRVVDGDYREALRQAVSDRSRVLAADVPAVGSHRPLSPRPPTKRELEVLQLIADGLSWNAAAAHLSISTDTVRTHMRHVKEKLGATTTPHACTIACRARLIV